MTDSEQRTLRLTEPRSEAEYELVSEAGSGGMGIVWQARRTETGERVAVKLLRREGDLVRFALETNALSRLHHPNIVAYVGHGVMGGEQFLAMEWLEGESLSHLLGREKPPLRRVLEIGRDVAAALACAHEQGIVHRDLKPSNIFLTATTVKVLDFGVARITGEAGLTRTGELIGTPSYMAPEQARGEKTIGPRADLFSLGCVIYKCVAGESPFAADDVMTSLSKLANDVPLRLQGVPRALADLVARLLDKRPEGRPESARDVQGAIDAMLRTSLEADDTPRTFSPTLQSAKPPDPRKKRAWATVLVAGVAASALGAIGIVAYTQKNHSPSIQSAAPTASSSAGSPAVAVTTRAVAARACRTWATELARRQQPDGSFAGEAHRAPTGWDTAQELAALEGASACASVAPVTIHAATEALARLRRAGGWSGPERFGPPTTASVPSTAWALLALTTSNDPSAPTQASVARSLLEPLQRDDGSFAFTGRSGASNAYATLVSAWALLAAHDDASSKRARDWLRNALRSPDVRDVAGLEEQTLWLLLEARRVANDVSGEDVVRAGAADIVARCALDAKTRACTRPVYDDGSTPLGGGSLVTLWHPWLAAATDALLASTLTLAPELRADLEAVARWSMNGIDGSIDALAALPEYKLAEYLVAVSAIAGAR